MIIARVGGTNVESEGAHPAIRIGMAGPSAATAVPGRCRWLLHVLADTADMSCYRIIMGKRQQIET